MAGTSDQEKEVRRQIDNSYKMMELIDSGQYNVKNRYDNYKNPFDYNAISQNLNDIFGETEAKINRSTADQIAGEQGNALSRFASRGVTGGSVIEDNANRIATNMNESKVNALSDLGIGKASSTADLQKYFNQLGLAKTDRATRVDQGNTNNVLNSLLSLMGAQQGLAGGLDDTTWLDDAFAGLQTAAQVGTAVAGLSDRNFKDNIVRVGEKDGIPIYEFNYIGSPVRLRGVMADEIPENARVKIGAINFVDYSKLPIKFEEV